MNEKCEDEVRYVGMNRVGKGWIELRVKVLLQCAENDLSL
jgi:hypothetical protein